MRYDIDSMDADRRGEFETVEKLLESKECLTLFLDALKRVRAGERKEITGICHNVCRILREEDCPEDKPAEDIAFDLMYWYSVDWPESVEPGRFLSFPVGRDINFDLWEGTNLKRRLSLLDYVIEQVALDIMELC